MRRLGDPVDDRARSSAACHAALSVRVHREAPCEPVVYVRERTGGFGLSRRVARAQVGQRALLLFAQLRCSRNGDVLPSGSGSSFIAASASASTARVVTEEPDESLRRIEEVANQFRGGFLQLAKALEQQGYEDER